MYQWSWLIAYQTRREAQCRVPWENITLDFVTTAYQLDGLRVDAQPLVGFYLPVILGMVGWLELVGKLDRE